MKELLYKVELRLETGLVSVGYNVVLLWTQAVCAAEYELNRSLSS